jgi:hypothetical protein
MTPVALGAGLSESNVQSACHCNCFGFCQSYLWEADSRYEDVVPQSNICATNIILIN